MLFRKYGGGFLFGLLGGLAFPPLYLLVFLPLSFYYLLDRTAWSCVSDGVVKFSKTNKNWWPGSLFNNVAYDGSTPIKHAFLQGLAFGFGYYLVQLYWISFSLFVDIKAYFWLFPLAVTIIPLVCALYFAFSVALTAWVVKKFAVKNRFLITVAFAFFYVLFEFFRGFLFPWNFFAYILGFSDIMIQFASVANIYFFDFLLVLSFCFGFVLFDWHGKKVLFLKQNRAYAVFYFATFLLIFNFGFFRLLNAKTKSLGLNFRIVQANIPQTLKWNRQELRKNLRKYLDLTMAEGYDNIDIAVWPESSIPYLVTEDSDMSDILGDISSKTLISGSIRGQIADGEIEKIWNSAIIFRDNKVVDYYDKSILVPFGEYMPFSKYIPFIKKITDGNIDFSRGDGNRTLEIDGLKVSLIVCYEVIFPSNVIDKNNRPDLIINLTNDGWFGHSSGPYQHLVASKFRAVENKLPLIRASNSGISVYIDEYGRIVKKLDLNRAGTFDIINSPF